MYNTKRSWWEKLLSGNNLGLCFSWVIILILDLGVTPAVQLLYRTEQYYLVLLASEFRGPQAACFVPVVLPVLQIICEAAFPENCGGFLWEHSSWGHGKEMLEAEQELFRRYLRRVWRMERHEWEVFMGEGICLFFQEPLCQVTVPQWGLEMKQFYLESMWGCY